MIIFENIKKTYIKNKQQVHALNDINLTVDTGDIYGLIGWSGAGKSSLIRLVNQLEKPTSGTVTVDGVDLNKLDAKAQREHKKKIGMIFQHFNLLESKTVAQNIAIPLVLQGLKRDEIDRRVDAMLSYVDLAGKKQSYPSQLSGGQKQRVGIARALITEPTILLCDEATSALDPQTTLSILKLLKQINSERNITILLVTHEMEVISSICNKVAVMEKGQVIEKGTVLDIFSAPQQETTKKFVSTVINAKIPEAVLDSLVEQENIFRLEFLGNSAREPVVNELILKQLVEINILFANMREIGGVVLGSMFIQMNGIETDVEKALAFLQDRGVRVERGGV
ncbi:MULTISPECIES: methionine ABC transporter ATP-binding protein [Snodgrassella]|uniref:methionine ABC transporter ATP-binding protein n=1 Tax=Snodgrassella TaxID=1193515 RepID=UPI000A0574F7|nr:MULTISPECIES: ATP-binding cassette domain-containing protein [Snodgrassella]MBI0129463.1 ATP-binding cassette domain-containing protein [Snodgrassella sp. W8124]MBI0164962.1 ATP-binding cassette domain-containing protein [Snodgrassella sp. M0351]MBI0181764.1 ATP-binding cassette domain-containing protein [Snodgrassella sp. W8158]MCT6883672.1 ATP-binding cassette domain-containing protein [Snodgrassella alvi]ORF27193.1 methionine ABC transporter ATP-binding protein [Snodgrassella alvi]